MKKPRSSPLKICHGSAGPSEARESPDFAVVAAPAHRIGRRVFALRIGRAPAVLEIIDALRAHEIVLDAAEIDPDVRVLVAEQRPERQEFLAAELAPVVLVGLRPLLPGIVVDRMRRRAERQDVEQHGFVVAAPVEAQEAGFRPPAMRDRGRPVLRPAANPRDR